MKKLAVFLFSLFMFHLSPAQKKPLDHSVYDSWQHIGERMISNDGKWVVYTIDPQEGDNELVIHSSDAKYKRSVPRGYSALITEDSRYVVFKIKPLFKDTREAKIKKKKAEDMPKDSMAIIELVRKDSLGGKEEIWKTEKIKSFKTPQKSAGWVAYQLDKPSDIPAKVKTTEPKANTRTTDSLKQVIDSLQRVIATMPQGKKKNKNKDEDDAEEEQANLAPDFGPRTPDFSINADGDDAATAEPSNDLIVRELGTGKEMVIKRVLEYYFSKTGNKLLLEQTKNPSDSLSMRQILLYDLNKGTSAILSRGGNDYKNFALSDDGSQIAYVAERDAGSKDLLKFYKLWYYKTGMDSAELIADKNSVGMQLGMTVSEFGNTGFSKSGKRLFFGTSPIQPPKDTTIVDMDMPKVDIWHYNDDYLQTVQLFPARLKAAQQENFLAVYDISSKTIKQLGNPEIPLVLQTNEGDGDVFVGTTDVGKRVESQWLGGTRKDVYAIDVNTSKKKLVKKDLHGQVYPSSTGKYIMWYDRKARNYFNWDGTMTKNITEKIKVPLYQEDWDTPDEPANYGIMGWHEGDSSVYIYDRYDIWRIDLLNELRSSNMTGMGRAGKERIRYIPTDPETRFFKSNQQIFYRVFDEENKSDEIVESQVKEWFSFESAERCECLFGAIAKAKNSNSLLYTKETFEVAPDLYIDNLISNNVEGTTKLSSINLQQAKYTWGTAELFKWKAYNGKNATGIVYKPENFDPKKKYPMIVYFYEKLSDGLYDYKEPAPIRSAINVPFFVSRGYIIFYPDIEYKTGYPGQGAYDYIVSGTRALVKKGWVDSANMALQGHSWGGYQAVQVATMTKLYKAIWAGAPVANMTSAYGGIRWESGVSRQFQYEKTQSRIGATLWERPDLYLKNSPLFNLDKVTAPMVIMANDADGAVPWYQGIELFTGLRRLGKKVWMFNYNGQGHGLTQRQDMKDYQIRMQQFFDWILKGEKPAKWITEGVPAVKKGKEWGLDE
ncbi:MAG TPA: prolyl oligopeptidase family serine peptidase [Chitinophagaceae bacterium]|nr:prolyl oligopeptidase family serine peptidase [Chitinophagaceae bacterium]